MTNEDKIFINEKFDKILEKIEKIEDNRDDKFKDMNNKIDNFEKRSLETQSIFIPLWMVKLFSKWLIIPFLTLLGFIFGDSSGYFDALIEEYKKVGASNAKD